jgi:hypothetical protein
MHEIRSARTNCAYPAVARVFAQSKVDSGSSNVARETGSAIGALLSVVVLMLGGCDKVCAVGRGLPTAKGVLGY